MREKEEGRVSSLRQIPSTSDPANLSIAHAHYDHSEADQDINCVFPLARLLELEVEGFVGECAPVHYSIRFSEMEISQHLTSRHAAESISTCMASRGCYPLEADQPVEAAHPSAAGMASRQHAPERGYHAFRILQLQSPHPACTLRNTPRA
jgi:hypothetical protein